HSVLFILFLSCSVDFRALPSFPTRRSSDLGFLPSFSFPYKQSDTLHSKAPSLGIKLAILCCSDTSSPYPLVAVMTVDLGPSVVNVQLFNILSCPYLFLASSNISSRLLASAPMSIF